MTEIIVASMELLLKGYVSVDYLLTGLVTSSFVATLVVIILVQFRETFSETQLQLRTIIETEPECVKLLAADGSLLQMNRAGLNMIEADCPNQVLGQRVQQIVLPKYRNAFVTLIKQVFEGKSGNLEFEIRGLKGTHRWLETHAVPLRDRHGTITALLSITRDITERRHIEQRLKESESHFRDTFEYAPIGVSNVALDKHYLAVNQTYCDIVGYSREELLTMTIMDLTQDQDKVAHTLLIQQLLTGEKKKFCIEKQVVHKDHNLVWVSLSVQLCYSAAGSPDYIIATIENITERKLAETHTRIAATVFESQEGMLITDANKIILKVNHAFTRITGYSADDVIGKTPQLLGSGQHDDAFYAALWQSIHDMGVWQGEVWNRRKNGDRYPQWLTITAVKDNDNGAVTHYVATMVDITERKATEKYINHLAFYDPLTQLPNRRLLQERLKHGINLSHRTGGQMAVLMLDLDKFKAVNDNFGHAAGDELLQQAGERIKARLRKVDMVARLGGDEFVVLMENAGDYETVARVAEAIIDTLRQPFTLLDNHTVYIGTSIGIAIYPHHGDNADALMDNADTALYHAKDSGRGCFAYFSNELTQKARERIALEARLRRAIEQQELQVYFQAQIDINSNRITGAEALVRWHDPVKGCIMPNDFIPLAEETGLIVAIGEFVLRKTCQLGRQWLDQGLPAIILAVNVSPHQFSRCDINALVAEILKETGFPASYLELEITESGLMDNQEHAMAILNKLHKQGVRLAIDDFGTGYSSLAYLKYFPLDVLKIDKTFVDDIPFLQGDMAITATIIAMAHHLGFKVLAEGVETQEQLAFLQQHQCDSYQGYLHGKAVPADDFAKSFSAVVNVSNVTEDNF
jgi:diguanylate cyclase (GGDEF)-like protein/PAS domain S-box-containing protein